MLEYIKEDVLKLRKIKEKLGERISYGYLSEKEKGG